MSYAADPITNALKKARKQQGLNQQGLSHKTGLPQAQISKIENNLVDPRLSSLLTMAHALGFELQLIPKNYLNIVKSLINPQDDNDKVKPAYTLEDDDE